MSLEERKGDDEEVFEGFTTCFLDQFSGCGGGSACCDQVAGVSFILGVGDVGEEWDGDDTKENVV